MNMHELREAEKPLTERIIPVDSLVIPTEVLDLIRFMCQTWAAIDVWAYANMTVEALGKYPVIQGTSNQISLMRIGEQTYDKAAIGEAVQWMLSQQG